MSIAKIVASIKEALHLAERGANAYGKVTASTTRLMLAAMFGITVCTLIIIAFVAWVI